MAQVPPVEPTAGLGRRAVLTAAVPLLLAGCAGGTARVASGAPGDSPEKSEANGTRDITVVIIRHGEKPGGGQQGTDENNHADPKSLTERGWARARALPRLFAAAPGQSLPARLVRPRTVYAATDQGPHAGAHRMRQTVTPLAERLGLTVDTGFAEGQETALAAAALAATGPVLICWEHSRIPAIVQALGASGSGVPTAWPDRYDLTWVFSRTGGSWSFRQVGQHLLEGDS